MQAYQEPARRFRMVHRARGRWLPLVLLVLASAAQAAPDAVLPPADLVMQAAPFLRCDVAYGGVSRRIDTPSGSDPYTAQSVDIDGRFEFKAVVRGNSVQVEAMKIYVYLQTASGPVLLHEARHRPPFAAPTTPDSLTGEHTVIAPPLERQLHYACALHGAGQ